MISSSSVRGMLAEAAPELVVVAAPVVISAAAMDGNGKPTARSAAPCEEPASASVAEAAAVVVAGAVVAVAVAAVGAMSAVAAAAGSMVTFSAGAGCAAEAAMSFWEAIAVAPLGFGRRSLEARVLARAVWESKGQRSRMAKEEEGPQRWLFNAVAPRFVPPNGQVRDTRHASDICAT